LKPGVDMFGDVLREAHARHIRVIAATISARPRKRPTTPTRVVLSQSRRQSVIYNGLYSTCINGGYYRQQVMRILAEGLENYDVDGLFFNMFGNQSTDYSGAYVGLCTATPAKPNTVNCMDAISLRGRRQLPRVSRRGIPRSLRSHR